MEIRDPVHGSVPISALEQAVMDHPLVQRLRRVRQLGFGEQAFPGATHTRFLHSIGTMHLAGLAFDAVSRDLAFVRPAAAERIRAVLRLAALLHDVGHPPLSHSGEAILPDAADLGVPGAAAGTPARHEEMTLALVRGGLAGRIDEAGRSCGVEARHVAVVLGGEDTATEREFVFDGVSLVPLLRQLVAGELDVDRMDYLVRDSYFTGVAYGRFDREWLMSHLRAHCEDGAACLALDERALFTFEDFLLSRFHMFLMVYSHHKTMIYHRMLERVLDAAGPRIRISADPDAFARCDDEWLISRLRESDHPYARRIVEARPLKRAVEVWDEDAGVLDSARSRIVESLPGTSEWMDSAVEFSKYFKGSGASRTPAPLMVIRSRPGTRGRAVPFEETSDLFQRHARQKRVIRIYGEEDAIEPIAQAVYRTVLDRAGT